MAALDYWLQTLSACTLLKSLSFVQKSWPPTCMNNLIYAWMPVWSAVNLLFQSGFATNSSPTSFTELKALVYDRQQAWSAPTTSIVITIKECLPIVLVLGRTYLRCGKLDDLLSQFHIGWNAKPCPCIHTTSNDLLFVVHVLSTNCSQCLTHEVYYYYPRFSIWFLFMLYFDEGYICLLSKFSKFFFLFFSFRKMISVKFSYHQFCTISLVFRKY